MVETMEKLADRRTEAVEQLDRLRTERMQAILGGKPYANDRIDALEAKLEGLHDATGEVARRQRAEREEAIRKGRAAMRRKIALAEESRLEAVEKAEKAAKDLASALGEALRFGEEAHDGIRALGLRPMADLARAGQADRLSRRLAVVLEPVLTGKRKFGDIQFREPFGDYSGDWKQAEIEAAEDSMQLVGKDD